MNTFYKAIKFMSVFIYITVMIPLLTSFILVTYTQSAWNLTTYLVIKTLQIKLKQIYLREKVPQPFITNGFILTNHRSFVDFFLDVYLTQGAYIGRLLAVAIVSIWGLQSINENRCILLQRGKDRRNSLWEKASKHKLILFWPEGTRCSHIVLPVNYKEVELKYGLLKSIYENKKPIQIYISSGKENVMHEKTFHLGFNETITYMIGEPIESGEYDTFDTFVDKVKLEWHTLWNHVYSLDENKQYNEINQLTPYYT